MLNPANCVQFSLYDSDENTDQFIDYEMDAFGNDLPGGNSFLAMDQPGPKEHLTGKMFDTDTGLYYFHARWYAPEVGRFVGRDPIKSNYYSDYVFVRNNPLFLVDVTGRMETPTPPEPPGGQNAGNAATSFNLITENSCCLEWIVKNKIKLSEVYSSIDAWMAEWARKWATTHPEKLQCLWNRQTDIRCEDCGNDQYCGYKRPFFDKVHICMEKHSTGKGIADTLIHEKAHICGWSADHPVEDPWKQIPVADKSNAKPCDNQIPVCEHQGYRK